MQNKKIALVFVWIILAVTGLVQRGAANDAALIEFNLKDQFNREYTRDSWKSSIVVLFGSDKGGSDYNARWAMAIQDSLKGEAGFGLLQIVAVANLRGVPFFLKGIVRRFFPKDKALWVLLDWKGNFASTYAFEKDSSNILIFDRNQQLVHQCSVTELQPDTLDTLLSHLRRVMAAQADILTDNQPQ